MAMGKLESITEIFTELTQDEVLTVSNKDIAIINREKLLRLTDKTA